LRLAGLAFQTAVELLDTLDKTSAVTLMRAQVRTHLGLVQALVADFRPVGQSALQRVARNLDADYHDLAESSRVDGEPYRRLCQATQRFVSARLRCCTVNGNGHPAREAEAVIPTTVTASVGDLIEETTALLNVWCLLERQDESSLRDAIAMCQELLKHLRSLPFIRIEIRLSLAEACIRLSRIIDKNRRTPTPAASAQDIEPSKAQVVLPTDAIRYAKASLGRVHAEPKRTEVQRRFQRLLTCDLLLTSGERENAMLVWSRLGPSHAADNDYFGSRLEDLITTHDLGRQTRFPIAIAIAIPLPCTDPDFPHALDPRLNEAVAVYNVIAEIWRQMDKNAKLHAERDIRARLKAKAIDQTYYERLFGPALWWLTASESTSVKRSHSTTAGQPPRRDRTRREMEESVKSLQPLVEAYLARVDERLVSDGGASLYDISSPGKRDPATQ
jgi:hypothetical protein